VLAIVDEAAQIPYFEAWQDAWGMAAGAAGLQLFAIYQGIEQIMSQMGNSWQTVIQNCGVTLWFGAKDQVTREAASQLAGVTDVLSCSRSISIDPRTGEPNVNNSTSQTTRPLLHPHDVGALGNDEMLAFCEGVPAVVKARRYPYLKEHKGQYRDNPYFKKPRGLWNW
jgi:type IV secretory pathway TraG/TraD family ATPase VirD4